MCNILVGTTQPFPMTTIFPINWLRGSSYSLIKLSKRKQNEVAHQPRAIKQHLGEQNHHTHQLRRKNKAKNTQKTTKNVR